MSPKNGKRPAPHEKRNRPFEETGQQTARSGPKAAFHQVKPGSDHTA